MSNKDDFISRRDAIEEISEHGTIWMSYTDDMSACEIAMEAISNAKDTMIRIIKGLPAVQIEHDCVLPEIIRCKDCKYLVVEEDGAYCDYNIVGVRGVEDGSGFCSDAKRKNG